MEVKLKQPMLYVLWKQVFYHRQSPLKFKLSTSNLVCVCYEVNPCCLVEAYCYFFCFV